MEEKSYRYILEKGSKKYSCPECRKKTFVRYIDTEKDEYLPDEYGRCDHESKCGYFLNPYLDGYVKMSEGRDKHGNTKEFVVSTPHRKQAKKIKSKTKPETVYFDFDTFKQTLTAERYAKNLFIQNLLCRVPFPFETDAVTEVVQLYRLGTIANGYRAGANTFPFIDINGYVRAIQVKQFDENNRTTGTDFLHSIIQKHHKRNNEPLPEWLEAYIGQDKRVSCLFGEHLLNRYPSNPVALVEAPKTAVYGTLYFGFPKTPDSLVWLAVYNKSSFSFDKLEVLKRRFVYVFPDLSKDGNTFREWENKAKEYEGRLPGTRFIFSELLERLAPERDKVEGNDIADYLIKHDWRLFRKRNSEPQPETTENVGNVENVASETKIILEVEPQPIFETQEQKEEQVQDWGKDIAKLEDFFTSITLPRGSIQLSKGSIINDCNLFIKSHFATVKANNGKQVFLPYLSRLNDLKGLLTKDSLKI